MTRFPWQAAIAGLAVLAAATSLHAQSREPHIGYVYPAGGRQGTSFEVTVGGQYLEEASDTYIAGKGVSIEVVKHYRPLSQGEYNQLRMKLDAAREELQKQGRGGSIPLGEVAKAAKITEDQLKEMEVYRKREADPKRQPNNQIIEEVTLKIAIAPDAELGKRELRMITPESISNPLWFHVNQWEERLETEPNDEIADPAVDCPLPVVVNGQIMPGDVDRIAFNAKKGTRLVIDSAVRDVMPYLADAVPGWFQAVLVLYDGEGNELAYAGDFYFRQDPVIYYEIPEDGKYIVEIRDSIYRGREDFVYRLTLGELPFVTGIFPLGGRAGTDVEVELQGWNLVETELKVRAIVNRNRPVRWFSVPQTDKVTVRFPLQIDMATEVLDQEPNDTPETAQEVSMPVIVNGRLDKPDDRDVFRFSGHGIVMAEVFARRGGSPVDSAVTLTDAEGREIGFNDDHEDKGQPLITHHADSQLSAPLSGPGPFYLHLTDAQRKGGHDFIYRLYIRPPVPDFELRVVPSTIIARPGAVVPITVHAIRTNDFDDNILLSLVEPPEGFKLDGGVLPRDADKVQLTLTVPAAESPEPYLLEMEGQSQGTRRQRRFTRPVIPAENMMQAFIWYQLVPAEQWTVVTNGKPVGKLPLELPPIERLPLKLGETTRLGARTTAKYPAASELRLELKDPPAGISIEKVEPEGPGVVAEIEIDAEKVQSGMQGNLIFEVVREWTPPVTEQNPQPKPRRQSYGYLPAVPFEVTGRAPRT